MKNNMYSGMPKFGSKEYYKQLEALFPKITFIFPEEKKPNILIRLLKKIKRYEKEENRTINL